MKWDREKVATCGLAILIAYVALAGVFRAASKPFWFDELCTLTMAQQPRVSKIWEALRGAADSHPPPFYVAERLAGAVVPNEHIAYRLPSILALCCVVFCVFVFVRRRSGSIHAIVCAVVHLVSILYTYYGAEARGYALATACVALALVCYQNAHGIRWAVLMGLSLVAASAAHYYAVFALVPLAWAEAAYLWKMRQLRWSVWLAIICGVAPLVVYFPMLSDLKQYYGAHYWAGAQATPAKVAEIYGSLFNLAGATGVAICVVAALGVVEAAWPQGFHKDEPPRTLDEFIHEKVLVLGLLGLPFIFFLAMKVARGGMVSRYLLETVLGFSLAVGLILPRLQRRSVIFVGTMLVSAFAMQETFFWVSQRHNLGKINSPAVAVEELVNAAGRQDLPVVISDGHEYLQIAHYAPQETAHRYVALTDVPAAMTYAGSDMLDKDLLALRPYAPVQVYQFQDFSAKYSQFLLYSDGEYWDWWSARLLDENYVLRLVGIRGNRRVYLVTK